jgi:hypothetical protein
MTLADLNKWISGETDVFDRRQTPPPPVSADRNLGEEMATVRPPSRIFEHIGIMAVVGGFAAVALVCFVLATQQSVAPPLIPDSTSQPSDDGATSTSARAAGDAGGSTLVAPVTPPPTETFPMVAIPMLDQPPTTLSDPQPAAPLRQPGIWYDHRTEAAPGQGKKASPPRRASRRPWLQHSVRAQANRGEAAQLMADELQQMGIAPVSSSSARKYRRAWRAMRRGESLNLSRPHNE